MTTLIKKALQGTILDFYSNYDDPYMEYNQMDLLKPDLTPIGQDLYYYVGKKGSRSKHSSFINNYGAKLIDMYKALKSRGLTHTAAFWGALLSLLEVPTGWYSTGEHIERNVPKSKDEDPEKRYHILLNTWADSLAHKFKYGNKRGYYAGAANANSWQEWYNIMKPYNNHDPKYWTPNGFLRGPSKEAEQYILQNIK